MLKKISGLGDIGVVTDGMDGEIPENAFSDALNMRFGGGYCERFTGSLSVFSPLSVTPYGLMYYSSSAAYWIYLGLQKAYAVNGATHTNITRQTTGVDVNYNATADNVWTTGVIGGIAVINNPADDPQFWAGNIGNKFAALTAWPANTKCQSLRVFKNYLIALNVTKSGTAYPHMVKWSHAADPGSLPISWDQTDATKDAGENDLADSQSVIVDGLPLGEAFIIYKERSYYLMEYIGAPYIFRFRKIYEGQGALSRNCVVETPYGHVVLGQGDLYIHNIGKPQSIVTDVVRKKLFALIDSANYARCFVIANHRRNEVWVCFPANGSATCNYTLVWNWEQKTSTFRELQNFTCGASGAVVSSASESWAADAETWAEDQTIWSQTETSAGEQRCIFGSSDTVLHLVDQQSRFNGQTITGFVERTGLTFGEPSLSKLVKGVRIHADGSDGAQITVRLGAANSESGAIQWGQNVSYSLGQKNLACSSVAGRFIAYRITTTIPIKLRTIEFEFQAKSSY